MEMDWENLEANLLSLIFDKLVERMDHIYFNVVCKNWYSIAKFNYQSRQIHNNVLPMLMIPTKKRLVRSLYGISCKKDYKIKLSVPSNKRLCGSSHGWLAKVDDCSKGIFITLINPFKNAVSIKLPLMYIMDMYKTRKYYEYDVHKVVLSTNPSFKPLDYIVVVIYSVRRCLAFLKAGQKNWTYIDDAHRSFNDVIFYEGLVYAVGRWNNIVSFDLSYAKNDHIIPKVVSLKGDDYANRAYLVKSLEGQLWLVRKFIGYHGDEDDEDNIEPSGGAKRFEVYNLELDFQTGELIQRLKIDSLGDNVLFLGDNDSVAVSASYFSNYLKKDSIYYTDDFYDDSPPYPNGPFDMKIYNVKEESFNQHCPYHPRFKRMPPALWVIPPCQ
ncbi:putative F-box protein At5g55150 [Vicia villosa]|uniref:putative F-box protein At5g55150 n=1 Tax=Vicia villosa TaxID=3911 RepID=UPI00273BE326|nr:putative F-box protein At5g55150 [Vicia villosa]